MIKPEFATCLKCFPIHNIITLWEFLLVLFSTSVQCNALFNFAHIYLILSLKHTRVIYSTSSYTFGTLLQLYKNSFLFCLKLKNFPCLYNLIRDSVTEGIRGKVVAVIYNYQRISFIKELRLSFYAVIWHAD